MKRIKEMTYVVDPEELIRAIDTRAAQVDVPCPRCGGHIHLTEAYINRRQSLEIDLLLAEVNDGVRAIIEAEYGSDPRTALLLKRLCERVDAALRPKLKVVRDE